MTHPDISVVIPIYNEAAGLAAFHESLVTVLSELKETYEIIYVDDGSSDESAQIIRTFNAHSKHVKLLSLSRNFGKENALTAGIAAAYGKAIITCDGDGQHPVELIPTFVAVWQEGVQVVAGVRSADQRGSWLKRLTSWGFYTLFKRVAGQQLQPGSTDFRLIDAEVRAAFLNLSEQSRITRGLIDWLGFQRQTIPFTTQPRMHGTPSYGYSHLIRLAINSFVSLSPRPLYIFGIIGAIIAVAAFFLGLLVLIEQLILGDPLGWHFTGTAMLAILILFLVGIVLMSQGVLSLYIAHIHEASKGRPLYVVNYAASAGVGEHRHV